MAQGYVHAQDRLWQMEVWRHISSGRLSELFGASTLATDRFIRTLGWRAAATRDLAAFSPDVRAALAAYADGVNGYLDGHRGSLGLPFVVTGIQAGKGGWLGGYDPEPWTPLDSAAWQKVQSWNLAGNFDSEVFRMLADARLGDPTRTDELFPAYPSGAPIIMESTATGAAAGPDRRRGGLGVDLTAAETSAWRAVAGRGDDALRIAGLGTGGGLADSAGIGSNNWVVAPSHSATGGALLANDPHLGIGMPSVWYMNGLHCRRVSRSCPFDVVGVSFPGVPAVVLGHNRRIAWGATNVDPDVQDLYIERVDPAHPDRYLFRGRSVPFITRREEIRVAGRATEILTVRSTRHGPLLNGVDPRLKDAPLLALRWTALAEPDLTLEGIFRINTAGTFAQFRAALRSYGSPAQNFVYADVEGHIGYQLPGFIPIRPGGDLGDRPVRGDDGKHEWTGRVPYDRLPRLLDPAGGIIVTANNSPVGAGFRYFLGREWDPGYRARQILGRLDALDDDGLTTDELRTIQLDTRVPRAALVVPKVVDATASTADGRAVLDAIRGWNFQCPVESAGCAAYHAFELRLAGAIFDDELGPLAREYVGDPTSLQAMIAILDQPGSAWWDDVATPGVTETRKSIIDAALVQAGAELRRTMGDPAAWRWGTLHQARFDEATLGQSGIAPLEWYFDRGPVEAPGAAGAVVNNLHDPSRGYPDPDDPAYRPVGLDRIFDVSYVPSYRLTIDLSDLDDARIVQTTGQGGNPFDVHYGDLIDDWREGRTLALPFSQKAVEQAAAATLMLTP